MVLPRRITHINMVHRITSYIPGFYDDMDPEEFSKIDRHVFEFEVFVKAAISNIFLSVLSAIKSTNMLLKI